jgi:hypothetical protein
MLAALVLAACDRGSDPKSAKTASPPIATAGNASAQLQELAKSNATVLGYLYSAETPYIVASIDGGTLVWRTQGGANRVAQGRVGPLNESDRSCIGFKQQNPTMPSHGPERYLICEALEPIRHSNSLPRSQDFQLQPGTLFLQYDPPIGTGFAQLFYAKRAK